jgi:hypothetical protein
MCIYFLTADRQSQVMKSTERQFFSEYRTYDVSLYYNAYLKKTKTKTKNNKTQ